jgi:hypothetical protein
VTGLRPIAFNKYIAAIMFFPPRCHPDGPAAWGKFPVARDPLVPPMATGPVSGDPNVIARRAITFDNYFVTRWRRRPEEYVYIDGCDQVCGGQSCAMRRKRNQRADGDGCRHAKLKGEFQGFCHHSKGCYDSMMDPNGNVGFGGFKPEGSDCHT